MRSINGCPVISLLSGLGTPLFMGFMFSQIRDKCLPNTFTHSSIHPPSFHSSIHSPSTHLSINPVVHPNIQPPTYLFIYHLTTCQPSTHASFSPSIHPSIRPSSIPPSIYPQSCICPGNIHFGLKPIWSIIFSPSWHQEAPPSPSSSYDPLSHSVHILGPWSFL